MINYVSAQEFKVGLTSKTQLNCVLFYTMRFLVKCMPTFSAQTFSKKSFILIFNSIFYLFLFRNKTGDHIPGIILHTDIVTAF